jgi:hypothetical protein
MWKSGLRQSKPLTNAMAYSSLHKSGAISAFPRKFFCSLVRRCLAYATRRKDLAMKMRISKKIVGGQI